MKNLLTFLKKQYTVKKLINNDSRKFCSTFYKNTCIYHMSDNTIWFSIIYHYKYMYYGYYSHC